MTLGLTIVSSWSMEQSLAEFSVLIVGDLFYICFVILICRVYLVGWQYRFIYNMCTSIGQWLEWKTSVTFWNVLRRGQCRNHIKLYIQSVEILGWIVYDANLKFIDDNKFMLALSVGICRIWHTVKFLWWRVMSQPNLFYTKGYY